MESGSNLSNFLNHFKISLYWMYFKIISWLSYVLKYQVVNRCIRHFCLSWLPPCLKMPPIQLKITDCLRIFLCFNKYRARSSTYLLCICLSRWGNCLVYDYLCDLYSTFYFGILFFVYIRLIFCNYLHGCSSGKIDWIEKIEIELKLIK